MQPAGGVGGGGGLQRYRSAPATWLEALLEDEVVGNDDVLHGSSTHNLLPSSSSSKPPQPQLQPQPVTTTGADLGFLDSGVGISGGGLTGFLRQNSSPAEFLAHLSSDDYFSSIGIQANYDYLMPSSSLPRSQLSNKRTREAESEMPGPKLSSPLKREQSTELHGGIGGLFDAGVEKPSEDSVLCRARAKRGFATHPRSIAERVRRTRISDRIRKLQELVPNMDKQTNTADMLEEAVEYVKFLQRQIEELTELQKKCKCSLKD